MRSYEMVGDEKSGSSLWQQKEGMAVGFFFAILCLVIAIVIYVPIHLENRDKEEIKREINLYVQQMDSDRVKMHLIALQKIATENGGNRAVNTSGYAKSVDYVVSQLTKYTNCRPQIQNFNISLFVLFETPILQEVFPGDTVFPQDEFNVLQYSGNGNVTGPVVPPSGNDTGCFPSDWDGVTQTDFIAVVRRGNCTFLEKAKFANEAGAIGVLIYNSGTSADFMDPFYGTLGDPAVTPVFAISYDLGIELLGTTPTPQIQMYSPTGVVTGETSNVLCKGVKGNPSNEIIVGSHLDSVPAGSGINDNGSGSALNLELAIQYYQSSLEPENAVTFAWWGAEEIGLKGSIYYVEDVSLNGNISEIALNLNFDMIGSPNSFYGIYAGSEGSEDVQKGSSVIEEMFIYYFDQKNTPYDLTEFDGRSDYGPFIETGIPAGGLFTGAEEYKSVVERDKYGGVAFAPYDSCYHESCDTINNINWDTVQMNAEAAAFVLGELATSSDLRDLMGEPPASRSSRGSERVRKVEMGSLKKAGQKKFPKIPLH